MNFIPQTKRAGNCCWRQHFQEQMWLLLGKESSLLHTKTLSFWKITKGPVGDVKQHHSMEKLVDPLMGFPEQLLQRIIWEALWINTLPSAFPLFKKQKWVNMKSFHLKLPEPLMSHVAGSINQVTIWLVFHPFFTRRPVGMILWWENCLPRCQRSPPPVWPARAGQGPGRRPSPCGWWRNSPHSWHTQ